MWTHEVLHDDGPGRWFLDASEAEVFSGESQSASANTRLIAFGPASRMRGTPLGFETRRGTVSLKNSQGEPESSTRRKWCPSQDFRH